MKRPFIHLTIIACCSIAAASCGRREQYLPPPAGSYSNVVLVTESGKVEGPAETMVRVLQHELDFYTRNENQFNVKIIPAAELEDEIPVKNMVLFGIVNEGRLGDYIERFIGSSAVASVFAGRASVFKKMDYPVDGQLTLIVTAASNEALDRVATSEAELIRGIIEEENRERLRAFLLRSENFDLEKILRARYGFTLRVPSEYVLNQERADVPGVELMNPKPDRGLSFSWRAFDRGEVSLADSTELYELREDFAYRMYDKDIMRRELARFSATKLGPYPAIRMSGYWENSVEAYGGAFVSYFLVDRVKARLWLIDCVVFAPGEHKHQLLRELHAVAETFRL
jgi:hypothetical protein